MDNIEHDEYNPKKRKRNDENLEYDEIDDYEFEQFLQDEFSHEYNDSNIAIMVITTHGSILSKKNKNNLIEPQIIHIPEELQVIKINIADAGNFSCILPSAIDDIIDTMIQTKQDLLSSDETISNNAIESVITQIDDVNKYMLDSTQKSETLKTQYSILLHQKIYKHILNSGDKIADKVYTKYPNDTYRNRKILLFLNEFKLPIDILTDKGHEIPNVANYIHLSELLEHIKFTGIKKLIIFDLSCSNILYASEQETHDVRQQLLLGNVATGGKNERKFKQKTKKTRNTKRHKKTKKRKKRKK